MSIAAGASIPMPFSVTFRLFLIGKHGFSRAGFFHPCYGDEKISSVLLAAAQSSLIYLEELLSKSGPIISFLFPAYLPLVSAFIFGCSNLTLRILSTRPEAAEPPVESIELSFTSDLHPSKEIPDVQGKVRSSSIRYFLWHARRLILLNVFSESFGQEPNAHRNNQAPPLPWPSSEPVSYRSSNAGPSFVTLFVDSEASGDTQRYRLGVNHSLIPVNAPKCPFHSYHRDGAMRVDGNSAGAISYEPNSYGEWQEQPDFAEPPLAIDGDAAKFNFREDDHDYYSQPGNLFRMLSKEEKQRLFDNTARAMGDADKEVKDRHIQNCTKADLAYGAGVAEALKRLGTYSDSSLTTA